MPQLFAINFGEFALLSGLLHWYLHIHTGQVIQLKSDTRGLKNTRALRLSIKCGQHVFVTRLRCAHLDSLAHIFLRRFQWSGIYTGECKHIACLVRVVVLSVLGSRLILIYTSINSRPLVV